MATTNNTSDIELGSLRDGYSALAKWIAKDSDDDPLIFRKFARLSARGLLHLQARLVNNEAELDALDEEARHAKSLDVQEALQCWETLNENAKVDASIEKRIMQKLEENQVLLKEYYEFLSLRSQISQLNKPSGRVVDAYKDFMKGTSLGATADKPLDLISGRASEFLDLRQDLVTLQRPVETDHLSRLLRDHWMFKKRDAANPLDRTARYRSSHIVQTVATLDLVLAAILLIGAIVTLYLVASPEAKLGLVSMFTLLFAASVALCTNAKRAEVFAATAAYAAVLVVFVSGDLGGSKSEQCLIQLEEGLFKVAKCPD